MSRFLIVIVWACLSCYSFATDIEKLAREAVESVGATDSISRMADFYFLDTRKDTFITSKGGRFIIIANDDELTLMDVIAKKSIKPSEIKKQRHYVPLNDLGVGLKGVQYPVYGSLKRPGSTLVITSDFLKVTRIRQFIEQNADSLQLLVLDRKREMCEFYSHGQTVIDALNPVKLNCNLSAYDQLQKRLNHLVRNTEMNIPALISHEDWSADYDYKSFLSERTVK